MLVAVSAEPQSPRLSTSRRGGIAASLARSYGGSGGGGGSVGGGGAVGGGGSVGGGGITNVAAPAPDKPDQQCILIR